MDYVAIGKLYHTYIITHVHCSPYFVVSMVDLIQDSMCNSVELMVSACTNTQSHIASIPPPPEMSTSV